MEKSSKTEEFICKAVEVHGNKYDYSKVEYTNAITKVCIICPKHGEFWQTPQIHLRGSNCPKCALNTIKDKNLKTKEEFVSQAQKVHGNKYDYSKVEYINNTTRVCIICPTHGEFWQTPQIHLRGGSCPKCLHDRRAKTTEQFIEESKQVHGDKYDYSKVEYNNAWTKVCIVCPKHGDFFVRPFNHLHGNGCPKCKDENIGVSKRNTIEEFIEKANKIHDYKYIYSASTYLTRDDKITITCPIHGDFTQIAGDHLNGHGCPKCANQQSLAEEEIYNYIVNFIGKDNVIRRVNNIFDDKKEIDIYIPSLKVGIEFNGLHWHSENYGKNRFYHLSKTDELKKKGIKLIQIFEDEWEEHKDIVLSKIRHLIGGDYNLPRIFGRKTTISIINKAQAEEFLNKNHIQGYVASSLYIGAFINEKLIGVCSFTEESKCNWNLTRMATDIHYVCSGVCGKMLSFFIKNYQWNKLKTFADRRWTTDEITNLYTKLGFKLDKIIIPDYRYVVRKKRIHKFNFRKGILHKKYNFPMSMTEKEMTSKLGIYKIWDCGLYKYIMEKQ